MTENNQDPQQRPPRPVPPQPQNPPAFGAGEQRSGANDTEQFGSPAPDAARQVPAQEQTQPETAPTLQYGQNAPGTFGQYAVPSYGQDTSSGHGGYGSHGQGATGFGHGTGSGYGGGQQTAVSTKKRFGTGTLIAGMLLAGLAGGGVAVGSQALAEGSAGTSISGSPAKQLIVNNTDSVNEITAAAAKASPSVVTISVASGNTGGSGSGIILDTEGHILTNTHVVTLGGQTSSPAVEVRTSDGNVHKAKVVGTDPLSDLAVIKIDAEGLTPATFGDSGKLNVGDTTIAIGAPLGLAGTVTDGIVSTLSRTISVSSSAVPENSGDSAQPSPGDQFNFQFPGEKQSANQGSIFLNVIQTDAAINHGNSGGALVNTNGEVIGVNVAIASSSEDSGSIGVGFSIPSNYAQRVAQELIEDGSASHGMLGVSVTAKASGNSSGNTQFSVGAEVVEVVKDSPAAKAGLQKGDVITGVEDRVIGDSQSLTAAIREHAAGSTVKVTYLRGGETHTAEVTLSEGQA
ncbi:MAG: S1C family serine protease [Actinomycetota bacterium]